MSSLFPDLWHTTEEIPVVGGIADALASVNEIIRSLIDMIKSLVNGLTEIFEWIPIIAIGGVGIYVAKNLLYS